MGSTSASGIGSAAPIAASAISRRRRAGAAWARIAAAAALGPTLSGASPTASVELAISGQRSATGIVRICLTAEPARFPDCQADANARRASIPASAHSVRFNGLASGDYALALIHDENANGRLDTFAGIPREGFGFSRNPAIRFGPPRFAAARFTLDNRAVGEAVTLRYLL